MRAITASRLLISPDINAHAKVIGPAQTTLWKLTCFLAPILGACLIAGSLTIDEVCPLAFARAG